MVLLAITLYAILTNALDIPFEVNGTYLECYKDLDCVTLHDKDYCYAGMCTDNCPPGYTETSSGNAIKCTCNTNRGFEVAGYFPGNYSGSKIPKCNCTRSFCRVTVYAYGIGYTAGLIPKGSPPNCKKVTDVIPVFTSNFAILLVIVSILIFTCINCRTSSGVIYDFHRYIGLYAFASIMVLVFVQTVGPFTSGFTRSMGFGVVIHNSAEWNFLLRLHYGKQAQARNCTNMCVMLYYVILLVAMTVLPLEWLLYVAMIQGGFLDWTLLFFLHFGGNTLEDEPNWEPNCKGCCPTVKARFRATYGIAAFLHLVTVEVLFLGFALNNQLLIGLGGFLLVPTFLVYTYFAYGEDRLSLLCGPSMFLDYTSNAGKYSDFKLKPFEHTTRTADVLWQGLLEGKRAYPVTEAGSNETLDVNDETVKLLEPVDKRIIVQDCENFKFGIDDKVRHCHCGRHCGKHFKHHIPFYWAAAFLIVVVNATIIIYSPQLMARTKPGCISGFDYGVW